jgi:hypothetical protein
MCIVGNKNFKNKTNNRKLGATYGAESFNDFNYNMSSLHLNQIFLAIKYVNARILYSNAETNLSVLFNLSREFSEYFRNSPNSSQWFDWLRSVKRSKEGQLRRSLENHFINHICCFNVIFNVLVHQNGYVKITFYIYHGDFCHFLFLYIIFLP